MSKKKVSGFKNKLKALGEYAFLLISLLLLASLYNSYKRMKTASNKVYEVEDRVERLKSENQKLKEEAEVLKSEEYKERELRDKLGLAKEGEAIVVLPEEEVLRKLAPKVKVAEGRLPEPNWKKWFYLFGF